MNYSWQHADHNIPKLELEQYIQVSEGVAGLVWSSHLFVLQYGQIG